MKKRIVVWVMSLCMVLSAAVQIPAVTASAQEIQQEAEAEEARRIRDFQNWKEMKVYEVERRMQAWKRRFEADEKKREWSVDELLALFERQQVNLKS